MRDVVSVQSVHAFEDLMEEAAGLSLSESFVCHNVVEHLATVYEERWNGRDERSGVRREQDAQTFQVAQMIILYTEHRYQS